MTPRDYWDTIRRAWPLVVATTLLGAGLAYGLSTLTTPQYRAQSQLFLSIQATDKFEAFGTTYYIQERMKSYVAIVDSPAVIDPVIETYDLDDKPNVSGESPSNTVLLDVVATGPDPEQVTEIADATAESLAEEIVRLETTASGDKPVQAEVIRPAVVPANPISPQTGTALLVGALVGLIAGLAIALLRRVLDTSVKSSTQLEHVAGTTSLGVLAYDPQARSNPLLTMRGGPRVESFRTIRTNLRYVDVDNPPKTVVITSSLPHEGKTTTACNLAIALAQAGQKVLLIEADLRRPKVADYLDVDGSVGLTDLLIGSSTAEEAVFSWNRGLLAFLPSGAIPPNPSELLGSKQMSDLLEDLSQQYDVILLDAPPVLPVADAAVLAAATDGALLVTRYGGTRYEQVESAADALRQVGARVLGTILNFAPKSRRRAGYGYDASYAVSYEYDAAAAEASGRRVLSEDEAIAPEPRA